MKIPVGKVAAYGGTTWPANSTTAPEETGKTSGQAKGAVAQMRMKAPRSATGWVV